MSKSVQVVGYIINKNEKIKTQVLLYENYIEFNNHQSNQTIKYLKSELQVDFYGSGGGLAFIQKDELKIEIYDTQLLKRWLNPRKTNFSMNWGLGNLFFVIGQLAVILSIIFWLWKNERWVDYIAKLIPNKIEVEIGQKIQSQLAGQLTYLDCHDELNKTVSNLISQKELENIQLSILNQNEPNAFATPGHLIYFNFGLFNTATAEEFIAIAAHEYGHIVHRHSIRSMIKILGVGFLTTLFTQDLNSLLLLNSPQLSELIHLKYSRELELEADQFAQQRLNLQNLPNKGLITFFNKLKTNELTPVLNLSFFNSHPSHDERIDYLKNNSLQNDSPNLQLKSDYSKLISCLGLKKK